MTTTRGVGATIVRAPRVAGRRRRQARDDEPRNSRPTPRESPRSRRPQQRQAETRFQTIAGGDVENPAEEPPTTPAPRGNQGTRRAGTPRGRNLPHGMPVPFHSSMESRRAEELQWPRPMRIPTTALEHSQPLEWTRPPTRRA